MKTFIYQFEILPNLQKEIFLFWCFLPDIRVHEILTAEGARYPIYRYLRLQHRWPLSLRMSLQHPRLWLTSRTSWPSLLSSGRTQPRPELCDVFHRRLGRCWKSHSGRPSSWLHWAHRNLSIGYSNGRLDNKGNFILTSHWDFVRIRERTKALGQSVKHIYSIQSDIIAS